MIPYGRKTTGTYLKLRYKFEGSVIPYGRKTFINCHTLFIKFEGSVIPYGRKTDFKESQRALKV